jgi:hypothetical protein
MRSTAEVAVFLDLVQLFQLLHFLEQQCDACTPQRRVVTKSQGLQVQALFLQPLSFSLKLKGFGHVEKTKNTTS